MTPAHVVEIETPKSVILNGLWFGPKKAARVIVWIHGLGSSVFSKRDLIDMLVKPDTAVLIFSNRGHDKVASIPSSDGTRIHGGSVHEVFTDCLDDIDGAIAYAKKRGGKQIFLAGHSTGCQKSVYWASKRGRGVNGIVLLAPISDYAATLMTEGKKKMDKALAYATKLVAAKRKYEILPESIWSWGQMADAQRYISLYSGSGAEETFPYWDAKRSPKALRGVEIPLLVLLAQNDEYADRSAVDMDLWFTNHVYTGEVRIVPETGHSFGGAEKSVAKLIDGFMKERYN